ncbi:MAG TPA: PDZ domain-containing protein, partial [Clostridia bacterium]
MKYAKVIKTVTAIFIAAAWFIIGYKVRDFTIDPDIKEISSAKSIIEKNHYGEMPDMKLKYLAIRGMLYNLGDKRANFVTPELVDKFYHYMDGNYGVIGITSEMEDGSLVIKGVRNGGPSQKAGLLKGDKIIEIDGWRVRRDSTYSENAYRIIGPKDAEVHLVIDRNGQKLDFKIPRIQYQPLESRIIDGNIGYIKQNSFNMNTAELIK